MQRKHLELLYDRENKGGGAGNMSVVSPRMWVDREGQFVCLRLVHCTCYTSHQMDLATSIFLWTCQLVNALVTASTFALFLVLLATIRRISFHFNQIKLKRFFLGERLVCACARISWLPYWTTSISHSLSNKLRICANAGGFWQQIEAYAHTHTHTHWWALTSTPECALNMIWMWIRGYYWWSWTGFIGCCTSIVCRLCCLYPNVKSPNNIPR